MAMSGIYKITNKANGKFYFGSSVNIPQRFREHKYRLRKGNHGNGHLQASWNRHGEKSFVFEAWAYCDPCNTTEYEQILLDLYSAKKSICYNQAIDAKSPNKGRKMSESMKEKVRKFHKGRKWSDEHKMNLAKANARRGKTLEVSYPDGSKIIFDTIREAAQSIGVSSSSIHARMKRNSVGGKLAGYNFRRIEP